MTFAVSYITIMFCRDKFTSVSKQSCTYLGLMPQTKTNVLGGFIANGKPYVKNVHREISSKLEGGDIKLVVTRFSLDLGILLMT